MFYFLWVEFRVQYIVRTVFRYAKETILCISIRLCDIPPTKVDPSWIRLASSSDRLIDRQCGDGFRVAFSQGVIRFLFRVIFSFLSVFGWGRHLELYTAGRRKIFVCSLSVSRVWHKAACSGLLRFTRSRFPVGSFVDCSPSESMNQWVWWPLRKTWSNFDRVSSFCDLISAFRPVRLFGSSIDQLIDIQG